MNNITAGWSRPHMKQVLIEMLPYLTDPDIEEFIKLYKNELERRYAIRENISLDSVKVD